MYLSGHKNAPLDLKFKKNTTPGIFAETMFDSVNSVYGENELQLKGEDPSTFAGFEIEWMVNFKCSSVSKSCEIY